MIIALNYQRYIDEWIIIARKLISYTIIEVKLNGYKVSNLWRVIRELFPISVLSTRTG